MRTRRLSHNNVLPRPPRQHGGVHHQNHRRCRAIPRVALQRQSGRFRQPEKRATLRHLARPLCQAQLFIRAGGGRFSRKPRHVHHPKRARSRHPVLHPRRRRGQSRPRHTIAQTRHALGRNPLWLGIRFRRIYGRCRGRLQHGRDGKQRLKHLQHQICAGRRAHRHRCRL